MATITAPNQYALLPKDECIKRLQKDIYISPSNVKGVENPKEFFYKKFRQPQKTTDAMILGRATHTYCLQFEKFEKEYDIVDYSQMPFPDSTMAKKENKDWYNTKLQIAQLNKKELLDKENFDSLKAMRESIYESFPFAEMLFNSKDNIVEVKHSAIALFDSEYQFEGIIAYSEEKVKEITDTQTNFLLLRTIPDAFAKDLTSVSELKTAKDVSPRGFAKDSYDLEYHIQAAMELDIIRANYMPDAIIDVFYFVAVQNKEPYQCETYYADQEFLEYGRMVYRKRLSLIMKCVKENDFGGYGSIYSSKENLNLMPLSLPGYYNKYPKF